MKLPVGHVPGKGVVKASGFGGLGERLLQSMGWEKGQGLGKEKQGMKEALDVKKKENTVGVGGNTVSWNWEEKWWEKTFDSAAQTVGASGSDSDSSDSSDDEGPLAAAISGAKRNRDGTATSASAAELDLLAELSKGGRLAAGRFGGRDAKMARIRAQEAKMAAEAAAKLGVPPSSTAPTTEASGSERSEETSEALHHDKKKSKKAKGGSSKRKQGEVEEPAPDAPAVKRIVIEPRGNGAPEAAVEFKPTPREGWWGARTFVSAGSMGDIDKEARVGKKARAAFDEDEQARIYTAAQAGKTQGKVGLGQATGTVKVGGVKWSGKKVTFEVEAVDGGGTSGNVDEEDREGASEASGLKAVESSNKLDNLAEGATATGLERVKWKKLIGEVLAGAPGKEMKVKGVRKEVHARVVQKLGRKVDKSDVAAAVDSVVAESSKFVLTGKVVRLKK